MLMIFIMTDYLLALPTLFGNGTHLLQLFRNKNVIIFIKLSDLTLYSFPIPSDSCTQIG
jgi:hypothetical protein